MTKPRLADIEQRTQAATSGPWEQEEHSNALVAPALGLSDDKQQLAAVAEEVYTSEDRAFITASRTDMPELTGFIRDLIGSSTEVGQLEANIPAHDGTETSRAYINGYKAAHRQVLAILRGRLDIGGQTL